MSPHVLNLKIRSWLKFGKDFSMINLVQRDIFMGRSGRGGLQPPKLKLCKRKYFLDMKFMLNGIKAGKYLEGAGRYILDRILIYCGRLSGWYHLRNIEVIIYYETNTTNNCLWTNVWIFWFFFFNIRYYHITAI